MVKRKMVEDRKRKAKSKPGNRFLGRIELFLRRNFSGCEVRLGSGAVVLTYNCKHYFVWYADGAYWVHYYDPYVGSIPIRDNFLAGIKAQILADPNPGSEKAGWRVENSMGVDRASDEGDRTVEVEISD